MTGPKIILEGDNQALKSLGPSVPNAELCKLMVWSLLAGFSEKFVSGALGSVHKNSA
ncbi:MAG: hypothetical protein JJ858_10210 [Rhizobiaceae bacterium]|nr:hypothetical protein [Rhizobiaceae bacterium]